MEQNKTIKMSLSTFLLIFAIFAIIILAFVIYNLYNENNTLTEQVNNANINTDEVANSETNNNNTSPEVTDESNTNIDTNEKFIVPSLTTGTMKNPFNNNLYQIFKTSYGHYSISIENGTPYINWYMADEEYLNELAKEWNATLNYNQSLKITGFTKQTVDVLIGGMGQDFTYEVIIFQMEDGTIEYSTIKNMMKNVSTQGKIEGLKNIIKLQQVQSYVEDGGGAPTIVAIDKDNNCYDLREFIDFSK